MADEQIQELRVRNDQICEEMGLPKFQKDEQRQSRGMSNAEYYTAAKGESWKFELMRVIDECMRYAENREEFLAPLRSEGYGATWTDARKIITYLRSVLAGLRTKRNCPQAQQSRAQNARADHDGATWLRQPEAAQDP